MDTWRLGPFSTTAGGPEAARLLSCASEEAADELLCADREQRPDSKEEDPYKVDGGGFVVR